MQVDEFETDGSMKEIEYNDIRSNCSSNACMHDDVGSQPVDQIEPLKK